MSKKKILSLWAKVRVRILAKRGEFFFYEHLFNEKFYGVNFTRWKFPIVFLNRYWGIYKLTTERIEKTKKLTLIYGKDVFLFHS